MDWGQHDSKGGPVGNGCYVDMQVIIKGFPEVTWEEAGRMYHDKANKTFKQEVNKAKKMYQALVLPTPFNPSSAVDCVKSQSMTTYYEVAFLTESEVSRLSGVGVKELKGLGPKITLALEDCVNTLQGWYFSLRGLSPIEALSVRKVRIESKVCVSHTEALLHPQCQIRKEQGGELFKAAAASQMASIDSNIQPTNRVTLKDLSALKEKALEKQEETQTKK